MDEFNNLKVVDTEIDSHFQKFSECYELISQTFDFPNTFKTYIDFINNIDLIKGGILEIAPAGNLYSLNILFRCLIEQYLIHLYIWIKFMENPNDELASYYQEASLQYEDSKKEESLEKVYSSIPIDNFLQNKDENPEDSKSNGPKKSKKQFRHENIVQYISGKMDEEFIHLKAFFLSLLLDYSELSAFVHGGPLSQKYLSNMINDNVKMNEIIRISKLTVHIATTVKLNTYECIASYEKSIQIYINETKSLIAKI